MRTFDVTADDEPSDFSALVAAASRDLEGIGDADLEGFLERAGRPKAALVVRGVGVCTGFQPEGSPHTDLMVEADASAADGGDELGVAS